ncbi:hypothetical protein evm_010018 [Chilo suppressalis]|nr:hypothetical protein evm_010018 [Chilo suppressalis]
MATKVDDTSCTDNHIVNPLRTLSESNKEDNHISNGKVYNQSNGHYKSKNISNGVTKIFKEDLMDIDWSQYDSDHGSFEKSSLLTAVLTHLGLYILMFLGFVNQLLFTPKVATEKNRETGKNTTMLLSKFTDFVDDSLNNKKQVLALFIDFSRAIDTFNHEMLIKSLENIGLQGPLLEWCREYLRGRSFCVKIQDSYCEDKKVTEGTAQGSVLGPVHFLAYVNDLNNMLSHCTSLQFADDTCLLLADNNVNEALEKLQTDFDALGRWCHDAGLVLNAQKTKLVHFSSPYKRNILKKQLISHNHPCFHSVIPASACPNNCQPIEVVDYHTYLGLVIDSKLNWKSHIDRICQKLRALGPSINCVIDFFRF